MHLVDAFIQSYLYCLKYLHFISSCIPWESNPWPAYICNMVFQVRFNFKHILIQASISALIITAFWCIIQAHLFFFCHFYSQYYMNLHLHAFGRCIYPTKHSCIRGLHLSDHALPGINPMILAIASFASIFCLNSRHANRKDFGFFQIGKLPVEAFNWKLHRTVKTAIH